MLSQLFIHNIAVIERASIDLDRGFTVLTGETGAGKSIIIDAIHAVLGERTSKELVRTGADTASVSALFTELGPQVTAALRELSVPLEEDGSLLVQREIRAEGRSPVQVKRRPRHRLHAQVHRSPAGHHPRPARELRNCFPQKCT